MWARYTEYIVSKILFGKPQTSQQTFLPHPAFSHFLIAAISFVIDRKELKVAQTAQIYQLFQTKLVVYGVVFNGLTHMLMSKNVNDFSKVSPKDAGFFCRAKGFRFLSLWSNAPLATKL